MAPHHGSPYGAIGIVSRYFGVEAPRDEGFRWITEEFPIVEDLNPFWAYRDPCPVSDSQFLVSYGGGGLQRFRICLLDEMDNHVAGLRRSAHQLLLSAAGASSAAAGARPRLETCQDIRYVDVPAAPPGQPRAERVPTGCFAVTDVYRGLGTGSGARPSRSRFASWSSSPRP